MKLSFAHVLLALGYSSLLKNMPTSISVVMSGRYGVSQQTEVLLHMRCLRMAMFPLCCLGRSSLDFWRSLNGLFYLTNISNTKNEGFDDV
jgi:hypothetical protein